MKYLKIKLEQVVRLPALNSSPVSPGNSKTVHKKYVFTRNFQKQVLPSQNQSIAKCQTYADKGAFINNLQNQHLTKRGSGSSNLPQLFLHSLQQVVSTVWQPRNLERQAVGYSRCSKELDPTKKIITQQPECCILGQTVFSVLNYPDVGERQSNT